MIVRLDQNTKWVKWEMLYKFQKYTLKTKANYFCICLQICFVMKFFLTLRKICKVTTLQINHANILKSDDKFPYETDL